MTRRSKWGILIGVVLAALLLAGFLFVRSARFQVWCTLRRVREAEDITAPERWLRKLGWAKKLDRLDAVARVRRPGEPAVAPLVRALGDEDEVVQYVACYALAGMGQPAVPRLIEALRSEKPHVRRSAAAALALIGAAAGDAVPALAGALRDTDWAVRVIAARALGWLGPVAADAVPALKTLAQSDSDERVRKAAAEALKKIQPEQDER